MELRNLIGAMVAASTFAASQADAQQAAAQPGPQYQITTLDYKRVDGVGIKADAIATELKPAALRPVVVWIHGGALINGYRTGVPKWMLEHFLPRGYAIVSIDYRLAPETKLPDIINDVVDAFTWIRTDGQKLFAADPLRVAVVGGSAGGYLTLCTGIQVSPKPVALVSLWGYGDLGAAWTHESSNYARHNVEQKTTEAEAARVELGPKISDSRERKGDGGAVYQHARRSGNWARVVSGWDPVTEAEKFRPYMPERNVTADFPPTFLIHGEADTDVPYECSTRMAEQFKKFGVPYRLVSFPDAEHGLPGVDKAKVDAAYRDAAAFVVERLEKK
jgi:acetyl esterase/lipase